MDMTNTKMTTISKRMIDAIAITSIMLKCEKTILWCEIEEMEDTLEYAKKQCVDVELKDIREQR
jgi:hypothetical protein